MRSPFYTFILAVFAAALTSCTTLQPAQSPVVVSNEGEGSAAQAAELTALDKLTAAVARAESFAKAAAVAAQSVKSSASNIAADIRAIKQAANSPPNQPQPAAQGDAGLIQGP